MSEGLVAAVAIGFVAIVIVIWAYASESSKCEQAGGTAVYEYKQLPSCWSEDGRRIFP